MQINNNKPVATLPLLQNGFRIFFLGAIVFSIVSISIWTSELYFHWKIPLIEISRPQWHGHEMIFGYAIAVISGFLLTAIQNWTGQTTRNSSGLFMIFLFWLIARCFAFYPYPQTLIFILLSSFIFYVLLITAMIRPLIKTRNNKQWGIVGKVILLAVLDILFLSSALGWLPQDWANPVLLLAVFSVIGLVLVMGARVIPGFTKNAISHSENIIDWPVAGYFSLLIYVCFVASYLFHWQSALLISGVLMTLLMIVRLWGWYDNEIWKKPLVWVLHLAIGFITLGILTSALSSTLHLVPYLSLHMMTYGGIGLITTGMMARVILGHTGRSVFEPPEGLSWVFILLVTGVVFRSIVPIFYMDYYFLWLLISQFLWIGAFVLMLVFYLIPLIKPRVDGRFG